MIAVLLMSFGFQSVHTDLNTKCNFTNEAVNSGPTNESNLNKMCLLGSPPFPLLHYREAVEQKKARRSIMSKLTASTQYHFITSVSKATTCSPSVEQIRKYSSSSWGILFFAQMAHTRTHTPTRARSCTHTRTRTLDE